VSGFQIVKKSIYTVGYRNSSVGESSMIVFEELSAENKARLDQLIASGYFGKSRIHDGKCKVCNTPLTDPESLKRGIGPDCFAKLQASQTVEVPV